MRALEVVIGPAGSGKTTMLGVVKDRLDAEGRQLVVVAPTLRAAKVASGELGAEASSLHRLLYVHGWRWDELGRFSRLAPGETDPATGAVHRGPAEGLALSAQSVVVVDEAALVTVDQANALIELVADSGAALRLVGDPRQLGAVGRGGVMESAARWAGETVELDQVHRFLRRELNGAGLPVVGEDVAYAELSLRLREGAKPDEVIDELVRRGAVVVHHSRAEAIEAMATEVASRAASPDALAVTVATNEDAADLNEAVRRRRVEARAVEDTVTAAGMDGVAIGAGDLIVTRRNDAARRVANRERFVVRAITDDGTVLARSTGKGDARQVSLDASYLAEAVQLGYVATDYGNQGVTSDASLTLVGGVTSAGGLYVGATRGRFENLVHVVAEDEEDARAALVAALERDRADRGLDVARARAEADSVAVSSPPVGPSATGGRGLWMDPASWRSASELDRAERAIDAALARGLGFLRNLPHVPDEDRERENDVDRQAAAAARRQAAWHRGEVEGLEASRGELVEEATADYFAARNDARIIAAGPGRFHRRAARLEAAVARRGEVARRWVEPSPPGAQWSDEAVRHQALQAAGRILGPVVREHLAEAEKAEMSAAGSDAKIAQRERSHERAVRLNEHNAEPRQELIAKAECGRAAIAGARAARDELAADLRTSLLPMRPAIRCSVTRLEHYVERERDRLSSAPERLQPSSVERGGPDLGL